MEFKFVQVRSGPSLLRPNHDLKRPLKNTALRIFPLLIYGMMRILYLVIIAAVRALVLNMIALIDWFAVVCANNGRDIFSYAVF